MMDSTSNMEYDQKLKFDILIVVEMCVCVCVFL